MDPASRVVTALPLLELWTGRGPVEGHKVRDLEAADIRELLRVGSVRFVVAELDRPLRWLELQEGLTFWKQELRDHVCAGQRFYLEDYEGRFCYVASEWELASYERIVVLERCC